MRSISSWLLILFSIWGFRAYSEFPSLELNQLLSQSDVICYFDDEDLSDFDAEDGVISEDSSAVEEVAQCSNIVECSDEKQVKDRIKGVVLLGPNTPLLSENQLNQVNMFAVENLNLPGSQKSLKKIICNNYIGMQLSSETILAIKLEIVRFYEEHDYPFVEVRIPNQDVTSGILQIVVIESHVGQIRIQGGRYTKPYLLERYLSAKPNGSLDLGKLRKSVNFMNLNPFRRVDLIYGPGSEPSTTDISLIVEDRRPFRFYSGFDNTGVDTTDRQRFFAGFNMMFRFDHLFTYQYTSTYKTTKFQAHTAQYTILLPWAHTANFYGGYSTIHADLPFPTSSNHGSSSQVSFRYSIPFIPGLQFHHEFSFGADFKRTNNTIQYSELYQNIAQPVNLTQAMGRYSGSLEEKNYRLDFDTQLFWSPGQIVGDQTDPDYRQLRPSAKNEWVYARGILSYLYRFSSGWSCNFWGTGQISSQNLLPSEQLGIGGYDTVRGYDERQLNYDGAIIVNAEVRTPAFSFLGRKTHKLGRDALQFLAFFDYGYGRDHNSIPGETKGDYLCGTGPGIRYTLNPWLTGRLDWGIKLHRKAIFTGGSSMIHFSLSMNI